MDNKWIASLKERQVKDEGGRIKDEPDSAKERGDTLEAENSTLKPNLATVTKERDDGNDIGDSLPE